MKRMHVHVSVQDIGKAVGFYSALFAAKPAVVKDDYAKWMLDDPRVNFAISTRGREPGSIILAFKLRLPTNCRTSIPACGRRAARSSSRGRRPAATQSRKSPGSTIQQEFLGKPSTPQARQPTTATSVKEGAQIAHAKAAASRSLR